MKRFAIAASLLAVATAFAACEEGCTPVDGHGPIAEGVMAPLGQPVPFASEEQLESFRRGEALATHRFSRAEGLGPAFNVTFCGSCHEKPTFGGSAGHYRDFFIAGYVNDDGAYFSARSAGDAGGVVRMYAYPALAHELDPEVEAPLARPAMDDRINTVTKRNPIPFFGVGLLAAIDEEVILENADPDDEDGDGISGRPNYDRGFVGRFGTKAQTVSIEGFIRGPLFNHMGITTDPLTEEQRARLPVDSSGGGERQAFAPLAQALLKQAQAAAPDGPLNDDDGVPDPELTRDELFDLVSWAMLLAAPLVEPLNAQTRRGLEVFDAVKCGGCHVPRLEGPRGPLPVYSDLLLHDMGPALADDGFRFQEATGAEFRTQPLWGVTATGPYLHDGRAKTLDEAIRMHGGEGDASRRGYEDLEDNERADLLAFLRSLGGRAQQSGGLIPPDDSVPGPGELGGPSRELTTIVDRVLFESGWGLFDLEYGHSDGVGGPRLNGDSCRACHFEPTVGGAGPRGVNVMRHGIVSADGMFISPAVGTILHKSTVLDDVTNAPQLEANVFEHRQTPALYGLGLVEGIADDEIARRADPGDADDDGISGRVAILDGGRVGRFGWKAQIPSVDEFVRDAVTAELGMTLAPQEGLTFGKIHDNDDVPDPEYPLNNAVAIGFFMKLLGPPPRLPADDDASAARGETLLESVGCTACHVPELAGADGPVALYSDLLLHDVLPAGAQGIEEGAASMGEFRTAPLWGISRTAPYLHSGAADTLHEAILGHHGEATAAREAYEALSDAERDDLMTFLNTL